MKKHFKKPPTKVSFPELEKEVIKFWKKNKIFEKSVDQRPEDNIYTFYDGPPFITGLPHHGNLLPGIAKDVIPRFWTMKGKRVRRVWGWDCHGLPTENKVEEKLGLKSKKDIKKIGISRYIKECYAYVQNVSQEWEWYIDRIGRWVDFKNSYKTMDLNYMETVIWIFARIYKKGLIYKGRRTSLFCPRCSTPLSNFEIAMDNSYEMVEDPAITIKFKLKDKPVFILAWTTTPWTLPGNLALAIDKNKKYVEVESKNERYLLAQARLKTVFGDKKYKTIDTFPGKKLIGLEYEPLYHFFKTDKKDYRIYHADFVSMEEGAGVVHIAPGFGEDDANFGKQIGLSIIDHVDEEGKITNQVPPFVGLFVKNADPKIIADLQNRNLLFKQEKIHHSYPFCYRCHTPLIYKTQVAWYLKIDKIRPKMLATNENINWVPSHLKHGRFKQGMEAAPDWCLSRSRYWASPIPVWECPCGQRYVPGSIAEIEKLSGQKVTNLHKPDIDQITIKCQECGKEIHRVPEVLDCWFESGSMPYAERHYPFEDKKRFKKEFPADYIIEYIAQTRGWFYTLHVIANALFESQSFNNVIVTGVIMGDDGRKMSKLFKNFPDPKLVLEKYGGEALRLYFMSGVIMIGENMNISEREIEDKVKSVLLPLWNCYKYLITYANLHQWTPSIDSQSESADHVLDQWIAAKTNQFTREFEKWLKKYHLPNATRLVQPYIEDLSRWYIRQSRERFVSGDKNALQTLWQTLVQFTKTVAPLMPFISEYFWQNLVLPFNKKAPESVHLEFYPKANEPDKTLLEKMTLVREICELGNAQRRKAGIKTRQPLKRFEILNSKLGINAELVKLIKQELNIKEVEIQTGKGDLKAKLDIKLTPELKTEGEARELIRQVQILRRKKELALTDKITIQTPRWPKEWEKEILTRTGATTIKKSKEVGIKKTCTSS